MATEARESVTAEDIVAAWQADVERLTAQVDILAARSAAAEASLMTARAEIATLAANLEALRAKARAAWARGSGADDEALRAELDKAGETAEPRKGDAQVFLKAIIKGDSEEEAFEKAHAAYNAPSGAAK